MREEQRTITIYIADDGKEFTSEYNCKEYELAKDAATDRRLWLNKVLIETMKTIPGIVEWPKNMSLEDQAEWIDSNIDINCLEDDTVIGYKDDLGEVQEFDENCPFDISIWHDFEKLIYTRYGYKIKDSTYYWGK